MMLMKYAIYFGVFFLLIGVLGYVPAIAPDGYLFGIIQVGGLHNVVHLLTGIIAIIAGYSSERASKKYFQIFGVIYAIVALLGLMSGDQPLLGVMAHNWAGFWFHLIVAVVALYLGFGTRRPRRVVHA